MGRSDVLCGYWRTVTGVGLRENSLWIYFHFVSPQIKYSTGSGKISGLLRVYEGHDFDNFRPGEVKNGTLDGLCTFQRSLSTQNVSSKKKSEIAYLKALITRLGLSCIVLISFTV
jgi:hypothetical protein